MEYPVISPLSVMPWPLLQLPQEFLQRGHYPVVLYEGTAITSSRNHFIGLPIFMSISAWFRTGSELVYLWPIVSKPFNGEFCCFRKRNFYKLLISDNYSGNKNSNSSSTAIIFCWPWACLSTRCNVIGIGVSRR